MSALRRRIDALAHTFPAFSNPHLRLYFLGQAGHILGAWVVDVALNLVAWRLTGSPAVLGALNFLLYGPVVIMAPLAGERLNAHNTRAVAIFILAGCALTSLIIMVLLIGDWLNLTLLLALAAVRGIFNGCEGSTRQTLIVLSITRDELLAPAIAMNNLLYQVARLAGPALAALLTATVGTAWAFALGVAVTLGMLVCVAKMPPLPMASGKANKQRVRLMEVFRFIAHDRFGRLFLPVMSLLALLGSTYQTLIPVLADRVFGHAELWTGAFFAAAGAGGLCAGLLLSTRAFQGGTQRMLVIAPWLVGLALIGLGLFTWWPLAIACFVMLGVGIVVVSISTNSGLQKRMPAPLRPGLVGVMLAVFTGMTPVAQALAGAAAQQWGARVSFVLFGCLLLTAMALLFVPRWWRRRALVLDPFEL